MSDKQQRSNHSSAAGPRPPISTKNPITGEELPEGYIAGFEPNSFFYNDDKGIRHSIYMPKGTHKPAIKYYEEQNWDELAKYPKWGMNSISIGKILNC